MPVQRNHHCSWMSDSTSLAYMNVITQSCHNLVAGLTMPRSHCADHSLPMFPIIADRHDLSWSWQNHQIVSLYPHSTGLRSVPDLSRFENRDQSGINVNWTAMIVNWAAMSGNVAAWSGRSGAIFERVQRLPPIWEGRERGVGQA